MLVDTDNLVSYDRLRKRLDEYLRAAERGPVAITRDDKVVGFLIGTAEYEAMLGMAVQDLLRERAAEPTISHEEAKARIRAAKERGARRKSLP